MSSPAGPPAVGPSIIDSAVEPPTEALLLLPSLREVAMWLDAQATRSATPVEIPRLRRAEALARAPDDAEWHRLVDLAARFGLPLLGLDQFEVDPQLRGEIAPTMARRVEAVPLLARGGIVAVALNDPLATAPLEFALKRRVLPVLAKSGLIAKALSTQFDRSEDEALIAALGLDPGGHHGAELGPLEVERISGEQPIVRIVNDFIEAAIRSRASDIHLRPGAEHFELLFRVDGDLISQRRFLRPLLPAFVSRIKVLGGMNLAEHRVPQDGRASTVVDEHEIDLRISVIPTIHGEAIVIRVLNTAFGLRSVGEIGLSERDEQLFRDVISRGQGMLLVTGPTGSGKSTTLYAAVLEARKQNVNIITIEDPVEAKIEDVLQVQIHRGAGLTFARTLRNVLRHDPDVIMIGEIRDGETAQIAVESALTGHLVFSTLHTNNAATTITRLLDLGVEPFLLKTTLLAVLAQRLARRNCPQCLIDEPVDSHIRRLLGVGEEEVFRIGKGCERCGGRGVRGRIGVYELLPLTPAIVRLIEPGADATEIHAVAEREGMTTLTRYAVALARRGVISLQEAFDVRVD